ncbi:MAG: peptide-methionine (R)-S-oxide reductase MsrB [Burkholderiaceae bacterium]|jgi:peptide-methionine (R)-S-oxide reductase
MKTDDDYKRELTDMQYAVTRLKHTEPPFTGVYWNHFEPGHYNCVCCGTPLYASEDKFDAGCGWPSYSRAIADDRIAEHRDTSHGMIRTEIVCKACGAHLGHVFPDGPAPTGMRHCVNAASLTFEPKQT